MRPIYVEGVNTPNPKYSMEPETGAYILLEIPKNILDIVARRIALRIGLKQGEAMPMRTLAAELGVQAGPDAGLIGYKHAAETYIMAWRKP